MPNAFGFCTRFSKPSRERRYSSVSTRRRRPTLARASAECSPIAVADPSEGARAPRDAVASRSGETLLRFSPRRSRSSSSPRRSRPPLRRVASAARLGSSAAMTSGASARHRADARRARHGRLAHRAGTRVSAPRRSGARRSSAGSPPRRARWRGVGGARRDASAPSRPRGDRAPARVRGRALRGARGVVDGAVPPRGEAPDRGAAVARTAGAVGRDACARRTSSAGARTNTSP